MRLRHPFFALTVAPPPPWTLRGLGARLCALLLPLLLSLGWVAPAAAQPYTNTVQGSRSLVLQTDDASARLPLVWAQCTEGLSGANACTGTVLQYDFAGAATRATTQNALTPSYLGYTDWRVPNLAELQSLVVGTTAPTIDSAAFPGTWAVACWTSESYAPYPAHAWIVFFYDGSIGANDPSHPNYVRLVRSGQSLTPSSAITLSSPAASNIQPTSVTLSATSSASTGHVYWIIVPSGSPAPTASQVVDGASYGSVAAASVFGGSGKATGPANTFNVTGLTSGQGYQAYLVAVEVAVDGSLHVSAVSGPLGINYAAQTLTFDPPAPSMTFGGTPGTVHATNTSPNSGNPITYSVPTTTGVCSVNSSTGAVTALAAGSCTVAANQEGNASYSAATQVTQDITIDKASQTLSFTTTNAIPMVPGHNYTATATSSVGLTPVTVTVAIGSMGVCAIAPDGTMTFFTAGTCQLIASQAGNDNYKPALAFKVLTVLAQLIASASPTTIPFGTNSTLSSSGGGGGVTYSLTQGQGVCLLNGNILAGIGIGSCRVIATDANGATATVGVAVGKASQTISFTTAPSTLQVGGVAGGATGTLAATTSATGLSVGFSSITPTVCTVTGSTVTAVTAGTCTVAAYQTGDVNYTAATQVTKSITITAAPLTSVSGTTPAGVAITAAFTGGSATCGYQTTAFSAASSVSTPPPAGVSFPQGLFGFTTNDQCAGNTLSFTLTYAQALPAGAKYYKFGPEAGNTTPHWYVLGSAVITTTGNTSTVTFSITDNGVGDSDLTNPGVIADPGGPGVLADVVVGNPTPVPTLGEWGLLLLTGLMGLLGMRASRGSLGNRVNRVNRRML